MKAFENESTNDFADEIKNIASRIKKISCLDLQLITLDKEIIKVKDIIYLFMSSGTACAVLKNNKVVLLTPNVNELQKQLRGAFLRVQRSYLVNIEKINSISRRYPAEPDNKRIFDEISFIDEDELLKSKIKDECVLHLEGIEEPLAVTATYADEVKKILGIKSFHNLIPDNIIDKKFRELELIDFGWRELYKLDLSNDAEIAGFKKKWDIKQFDKKTMLKNFRQVSVNEIDKRHVIKNIIWQLFRWIKKGIEIKTEGNIRSLWYKIKAVLSYHSDVLKPGDVDIFYNVLTEMIEDHKLFKYKDFGFMDVNKPYRGIGKTKPEIILASEKVGHYYFIKRLAEEVGISFICLKGEPAHISLEYFSEELMNSAKTTLKTIFVISDIDPAGFSIEDNLIRGLERNGHKIKSVTSLVTLSTFENDEINFIRYPLVSYEKIDGNLVPVSPATPGNLTKVLSWYKKELHDDRLISIKNIDGRKIYTIWGIESDAASQMEIRDLFLSLVKK